MLNDYSVKEFVAAVVCKLGGRVEGVKKLMKLVFLAQYDLPSRRRWGGRRVIKYTHLGKPLARAEFYIWSFGPMSNEVYDALDSPGFEVDGSTTPFTVVYEGEEPELPPSVVGRIDEVVKKYGDYRGWELELIVAKRLGIECPEKKGEYMGMPVDCYLEEVEGLRVEEREV